MINITSEADVSAYNISMRLLVKEGLSRGYDMVYYPTYAENDQTGIVRAQKGNRELFFKSTCTSLTPSYGYFAAENKMLTYSLLRPRGIAMPTSVVVKSDNIDKAIKMLKTYKSLVVKPLDANHGDGVTVGIQDETSLMKAVTLASASSTNGWVIVQQQVWGNEYRFLVVDGKTVAVAGRRPAGVVGDGRKTVSLLIDELNTDERRGVGHLGVLTQISKDDVRTEKGESFLTFVPQSGERVELLSVSNLSKGGESVDYTSVASSNLKRMAEQAADACFLGIAGVDIMTDDIASEQTEGSYVIEVNLTPGIRMHQFPAYGEPIDVAKMIFNALEKHSRPIDKKLKHIGRVERVAVIAGTRHKMSARIDTGATISSIWASEIIQLADGGLEFCLFDKTSERYTGDRIRVDSYQLRTVASSMGQVENRYMVKLTLSIKGVRIKSRFTLADRSNQTYPVLIGRNALRGRFIVDVTNGKPDIASEKRNRHVIDKKSELKKGST